MRNPEPIYVTAGGASADQCIEPARKAKFVRPPVHLTHDEIVEQFGDRYGPVLGVDEVCEITGLAPATVARKLSEGWCRDCVRRGKPVRFLRDRFLHRFFGGGG